MIPSPTTILVALVLWGASTIGSGWLGYGLGKDAEVATQQRERAAIIKGAEAAASAAAEAISRIEVKHVTVRQQLEREIQTREVFRDCRSGPDAVRLLNSTRPDDARPAGGGELPAAPSAGG